MEFWRNIISSIEAVRIFRPWLAWYRQKRYPGSLRYWEKRYAQGGDSGSGSSEIVAQFKAEVVNRVINMYDIHRLVELGCGDGSQLALFTVDQYCGLDISKSAIDRCKRLYQHDDGKSFIHYNPYDFNPQELAARLVLSLEVIFHVTEPGLYKIYLDHLFALSTKLVLIFGRNERATGSSIYPHLCFRNFVSDIERDHNRWQLVETITPPSQLPTFSKFFLFAKYH